MTESEQPKLGNTTTDIVASLTKGSIGAVPCVGSLMAEVVGNIIPNQRVDRIVEFIRLLDERLKKVEQERLSAKLTEPPVVDILEDGFTQAARATTSARLENIANVVANGIAAEELKQAEAKRMLWLLGQLNDAEVVILRSELARTFEDGDRDAEFRERHKELLAPAATPLGSRKEEFESAALKASYRRHLHDLGLICYRFSEPRKGELPEFDTSTGMMKANGADATRLGKMLLRYLDLVPRWYSERYERR